MGQVQTFEQHALDGLGLTMDYGLPTPRELSSTSSAEVSARSVVFLLQSNDEHGLCIGQTSDIRARVFDPYRGSRFLENTTIRCDST